MYSRHYRYNPLFNNTNPTTTDIPDPLSITYFDSIVKARAFLNQISCLSGKQLEDPHMQTKIAAANKIINKADRRNNRRKARRASKDGSSSSAKPLTLHAAKAPKGYSVNSCDEAQLSVERLCDDVSCSPKNGKIAIEGLPKWEETLGPKGELVRFKLTYGKSAVDATEVKERKRSKETPAQGDIILDLTSGVVAWKVTNRSRTSIPVTKKMENLYKGSFLYKVRQLAAGSISPSEFAKIVEVSARGGVAAKKSLRKKKKK